MRTRQGKAPLALAAFAVLLVGSTGCANILDEIGAPVSTRSNTLDGEVRSVDTRRNRMEVREYQGRNHTVQFDSRTNVVYRQRQVSTTALQRGDQVRVRISQRNGGTWADRVEIRENAQEARRTDGRNDGRGVGVGTASGRGTTVGNRVERIDGTVGSIDTRRGQFTIQRARQRDVLVYMPQRLSRDDQRRVERLRRGERVRVEVRGLDRDRAEFVRFR
jgi:hypothetical protein